ncbi:MAG TPA: redoxin domain-containing protein [Gemmataceae bacterium]|jgi:methylamine dehydrogenase accessory protein MauD
MIALWLGLASSWLLIALGYWLAYQLLRQHGRILLRLEALQAQVAQLEGAPASRGLDVGSTAPDFELPALSGERVNLSRWRGQRVLLIFFNPHCGFCEQMAAGLAALKTDGSDGRPIPVLITTGDPEENRRFMDQHGICCPVLVQQKDEVASRYQAGGTPMGYLLDEEGTIATPLTVGAADLLALAAVQVAKAVPEAAETNGERPKGKANRGLHASRLRRDGLKAGTPAPAFRLPRVDGGELSLEDFRGRRLLLVFSDPDCGPCTALAPALEEFHRGGGAVLMISRRDAEANQRKVAGLGLTFPVVLQRHWEISLLYGMFATPIAYLIDEQGVLATDVVVGEQPIRELMATAAKHEQVRAAEENGAGAEISTT